MSVHSHHPRHSVNSALAQAQHDYLVEVIPAPAVAILFQDKVVIVRVNGTMVERELAVDQDRGIPDV